MITFCNDRTDQLLYITNPKSSKVDIILMKDHHSEVVETSKDFSKMQLKKKFSSRTSNVLMQKFESFLEREVKQRQKGQMEQTHNIFKFNQIKKLLGEKVYDELFKEEQTTEVITFDINT